MKKNYFFGKYYKFIAPDGFSFALIDSYSDEGKEKQIITGEGGYSVVDLSSVAVTNQQFEFDIRQDGLFMSGSLCLGELHPLQHKAMGPFSLFSMECSHDIYSMYHEISGSITINGCTHSFDNGFGYIEGDKGCSFPSKYLWYNSVGRDYGVTLAVATIPFGLINFTGLLGFVNYQGREYRLCTYNFARILQADSQRVRIRRGSFELEININTAGGHLLKAPANGTMGRLIKENIAVPTSFAFKRNGKVIFSRDDNYSSVEFMY